MLSLAQRYTTQRFSSAPVLASVKTCRASISTLNEHVSNEDRPADDERKSCDVSLTTHFLDPIYVSVGDAPVDAVPNAVATRPTSTATRAGVEQTTAETRYARQE